LLWEKEKEVLSHLFCISEFIFDYFQQKKEEAMP